MHMHPLRKWLIKQITAQNEQFYIYCGQEAHSSSINTIDNRNKVVALLKEYFMQQNKKLLSFFTHRIVADPCCYFIIFIFFDESLHSSIALR